jgi:hypothetical protein
MPLSILHRITVPPTSPPVTEIADYDAVELSRDFLSGFPSGQVDSFCLTKAKLKKMARESRTQPM